MKMSSTAEAVAADPEMAQIEQDEKAFDPLDLGTPIKFRYVGDMSLQKLLQGLRLLLLSFFSSFPSFCFCLSVCLLFGFHFLFFSP